MSEELKCCPFCGSMDLDIESFGERRHCVVCEVCECSTGYMLDDSEAIESWNTRPIEGALQTQLAEWKAAHDNLARQLSVANDNVEIVVEAIQYALNDPYVVFGAYYTKKKLQEALKRLEQK